METLDFQVTGMTCVNCATSLEADLIKVPGVREVLVSFSESRASVATGERLSADAVIQAIRAKGYDAQRDEKVTVARDRGSAALKVVIIGSGSASFAAALKAVEDGAMVTIVEAGVVGGTCVNVGCVPSKILIRAAQLAHQQAHHPFPSIEKHTPTIDRAALMYQQ